MRLSEILINEAKERTLLGLTINGKEITPETKLHPWTGDFYCRGNNLTSLEHGPSEVGGYFYCGANKLTSLEHGPSKVGGNFDCGGNKLTSLEHGPSEVGGYFSCIDNKITSLKDIHKQLTKMNGTFNAVVNKITSHVLGILLVDGCEKIQIDNKEVQKIINNYLPNNEGRKGLLKCKGELVDAGFEDFAQL